jgi:hypothetical protein
MILMVMVVMVVAQGAALASASWVATGGLVDRPAAVRPARSELWKVLAWASIGSYAAKQPGAHTEVCRSSDRRVGHSQGWESKRRRGLVALLGGGAGGQ